VARDDDLHFLLRLRQVKQPVRTRCFPAGVTRLADITISRATREDTPTIQSLAWLWRPKSVRERVSRKDFVEKSLPSLPREPTCTDRAFSTRQSWGGGEQHSRLAGMRLIRR
jgi:hypothetical protein